MALREDCAQLEYVPETSKLSDVLSVVTNNYSHYHDCRIKVQTWQEWYVKQKAIFESVNHRP